MTITYQDIQERAKQDALEAIPELPKIPNQTDFSVPEDHTQHCVEVWEDFISDVENVDAYEVANQCSEWDWVIYYGKAMELCQAVPSDVLCDAESQWLEMGAYVDDKFGLFEFAVVLAAIIVTNEIVQAVEEAKEELVEFANNALEVL